MIKKTISLSGKCVSWLGVAMLATALAFSSCFAAVSSSDPILVFGHKNPDTDSIVGALAASHFLVETGRPAIPMAQGKANPETEFVLKTFGLPMPAMLGPVAGKAVGLVDFNDAAQGPDNIKEASLVFIVDHHKLGGLSSGSPLEVWIQPIGSANTLLYEMMQIHKVSIPKNLAGGMLCAILSDTVIYQSVTTTERDKAAGNALAKIAGVKEQKALGYELFKAKSALDGVSPRELVLRDYKKFEMSGTPVGVGQLEVLSLDMVAGKKKELLTAMAQVKEEMKLNSIFLMLTDISKQGTEMLAISDDPALPGTVFKTEFKDSSVWLPGVMSRKKQVIPFLEEVYKK